MGPAFSRLNYRQYSGYHNQEKHLLRYILHLTYTIYSSSLLFVVPFPPDI